MKIIIITIVIVTLIIHPHLNQLSGSILFDLPHSIIIHLILILLILID